MKTSVKILLVVAGIIVAMFITALVVLHRDLKNYLESKEALISYRDVPVTEFDQLVFSGKWNVKIRKGFEYKLEIANDKSENWKLTNLDSALILFRDTTQGKSNDPIFAKVTAPFVVKVRLDSLSELYLDDLTTDTMQIVVQDKSRVWGYGNQINYLDIRSSGNVQIDLTDDPND